MSTGAPSLFTAERIMTTDLITVRPDTTITEVAALLEEFGVSGLPVVDDQRRLLGVITEHDLLQGIVTLTMQGTVADHMTHQVATVSEHASIVEIARLFIETNVRRMPVVREGGELVGVISRRDLVFAGVVRQHLLAGLPEAALPGSIGANQGAAVADCPG
jgi:CBS domain-containing protein